jgi:hypothetical protein
MNETEPTKSLSRTAKKQLKKQQKLARIAQESKGRWWRLAIKCIAIGIAGLSAVETLIFFFPDFAVAKEDPLDVADALSVPFVVRYNGWIPLFDVQPSCVLNLITTNSNDFVGSAVVAPRDKRTRMWHDDAITFTCPVHGMVPAKGEIVVEIEYWPPLGHFLFSSPWSSKSRYVGRRQADGVLRWEEEPAHE